MRTRYCRVCRDFHDLEASWPQACAEHFAPRGSSAPNVISDNMDATRNMADGKFYDSKRGFEKAVRAAGCEIVGNDTSMFNQRPHTPEITGHDVKAAIEQLRSR
jgi:hypothetical protein